AAGRKPKAGFAIDRSNQERLLAPALLLLGGMAELHRVRPELRVRPQLEKTQAILAVYDLSLRDLLEEHDRDRVMVFSVTKSDELVYSPVPHTLPVLPVRQRHEQLISLVRALAPTGSELTL